MLPDHGQPRDGSVDGAAVTGRARLPPEPGGTDGKLGGDLRAVFDVSGNRYLFICLVPGARAGAAGRLGPALSTLYLAEAAARSGRTRNGSDPGRCHVELERSA